MSSCYQYILTFCVIHIRVIEEVTLRFRVTGGSLFSLPSFMLVFEYICTRQRLPWDCDSL